MPIKKGTPAYERQLARQRQQYHEQKIREQAAKKIADMDHAKTTAMAPVDPARWRSDPIGWAEVALGVDPRTLRWSSYGGPYETHVWDGDVDPLAKACEALAAGHWVGLESGKGIGKTFLAGFLPMWYLENFPEATVVSLAPKEKQLELHMWKQMGRFWRRFQPRFPAASLKSLHLQMKADDDETKTSWNAWGYAAGAGASEESASRAQGFHDEFQLFLIEEMPGLKAAIVTAIEETNTRPGTNLIFGIGNPEHQLDPLHRFCTSPDVVHIRASALDHPNVVFDNPDLMKGAVTRGSISRLERKYGVDHPRYKASVRGLSPAEAVDALIKLAWLQEAATRDVAAGAPALGVDVSNSVNGDPAAIAYGSGARLERVEAFQCPDANRMAREKVAPLIVAGIPAAAVGVDGIGVGAGAVNELYRLGHRVQNIQSGGGPVLRRVRDERGRATDDVEQYLNLRAQMSDLLADDLQHGRVGGPGFADPEVQRELTALKAGVRNGKTFVREKDKVREMIGRSPNKGDAVVYWNWVRQAGGRSSISGLGARGEW
jgi:hypothetical protein